MSMHTHTHTHYKTVCTGVGSMLLPSRQALQEALDPTLQEQYTNTEINKEHSK